MIGPGSETPGSGVINVYIIGCLLPIIFMNHMKKQAKKCKGDAKLTGGAPLEDKSCELPHST